MADEVERINRWDTLALADGSWKVGTITRETDDQVTFEEKGSREAETIPRSKIKEIQRKGLPVLVGTVSIEKSERLSALLERRGVEHEVLNAKQHKREAEIIAQAGRTGAVTIATNMAGRGTDIILGGNPDTLAWARLQDKYPTRLDVPKQEWDSLVAEISAREKMKSEGEQVREMGGLQIIGTERHEARRIDLQLRGRCGRQGDPGSSRFFLSLEDDLMRIFAGEWVKNVLTRLGMQDGEAIESRMVTRRIEAAQKKVEERNFDVRKNLLEYDEVMDEQRKRVYGFRQRILDGADCRGIILEMVDRQIATHIDTFLDRDYGPETYAAWAGGQLGCELDAKDFRGLTPEEAERLAHDQAVRQAETAIYEAIDENLPKEEDESEWNWEALASFANARFRTSLRDRDLRKVGRDTVDEFLIASCTESLSRIDLAEGRRFLAGDFGVASGCGWTQWRFGIQLDPNDVGSLEPAAFRDLVSRKAREVYEQREIDYPVLAGLGHFVERQADGSRMLDREGLVRWAKERFDPSLDETALGGNDLEMIRRRLTEASRASHDRTKGLRKDAERRIAETLSSLDSAMGPGPIGHIADGLTAWLAETCGVPDAAEAVQKSTRQDLERRVLAAFDERSRPEMRRMERAVVLQILDNAWKDHLLAMDHLRASVGLRGYAQVDPKVEYKREGMRTFDLMWKGIDERVVDIVFRIEQVEDEAVRSAFRETAAIHAEASSGSLPEPAGGGMPDGSRTSENAAIDAAGEGRRPEPIRNVASKTGRNDPCPCGSGKKFKNCCGRAGGIAAVGAGEGRR